MAIFSDIKQDGKFGHSLRILGLVLIVFFICDTIIGIFLTRGLEKYYGINTDAEIALVGHSHLMLGIDKSEIENQLHMKVSKYTREGVNIADRRIMIDQLIKFNPNLKTVIYGVDGWSFTGEGLSANSYTLFYPFMKDSEVDQYIKSHADFGNYWLHKVVRTSGFNEMLISSAFRGYLGNWSNLKYGTVDTLQLVTNISKGRFRKIRNSEENINIMRETISELQNHNIQVILLYVPTIDLYNDAEPQKFAATLDIIKNFKNEFVNVSFINYLEPWSHQYNLFYDPIHMNPLGQKVITQELVGDIKPLISSKIANN